MISEIGSTKASYFRLFSVLLLPVGARRHMIPFLKVFIEMCFIGKTAEHRDFRYRKAGRFQILLRFFQTEKHTVVIEAETGVFMYDPVEIVRAVIGAFGKLRT